MKFTIVFVFCLRCTIKIIGNYTRLIVCSRRPRFVIFFAKRFSKLFTKIISYYILSSKKLNKLKNYLIIEFEHEKDAIIANFFLNSLKIDEFFLNVKLYKKKKFIGCPEYLFNPKKIFYSKTNYYNFEDISRTLSKKIKNFEYISLQNNANLLNPNISFSIFRFKDFLTKEYYQQCVNGEIIFKSRLAVVPNDSFFSNNYYLIKNNHQCRKKIHSESVYFPNDHSFFFLRFYFSRLYSLKKFQEILEMISEMNLFVYNNKNDPNFKAKSILIIKVKFIKLLKILGNVFSFSEINEPVN